jgi:Ca2+-binding EF-hand superfamily protein
MKKLLASLVAGISIAIISGPAMSSQTVTSVVGYTHTETITNERDAEFYLIDLSKDGAINFHEFQKHAQLENEYEMFNMNDSNNDDLLTIEEFRVFSKSGPANSSVGLSGTNYNFNKSAITK